MRLLLEWANLSESVDRVWIDRFIAAYPEIFQPIEEAYKQYVVEDVRRELRRVWAAADRRTADWAIYRMRFGYQGATKHYRAAFQAAKAEIMNSQEPGLIWPESVVGPPSPTPFEAMMWFFQTTLVDRTCRCRNPSCGLPYFLGGRSGQKYCSTDCALPSQREAKLNWWHRNRRPKGD